MSVDKFGRYSVTGEKSSVSNKHCSLPLTPDGDYNIGNKRLKLVKDPRDNTDAINLQTLKAETITYLKLEGKDTFNAINCRIINIADPQNEQDSVTKGYADSMSRTCLKLEGDTYNANGKRILNVGDPLLPSDAINLQTMKAETLTTLKLVGKDTFNANNCRIINIADPQNEQDSVTKGYTDSMTRTCLKLEGDTYNANGKRIHNVGDPLLASDVVTIQYMNKEIPKLTVDQSLIRKNDGFVQGVNKYEFLEVDNNKFNAKQRKITNILPGDSKGDAATVDQILIRKGNGFEQSNNKYQFLELATNNEFDAKNRKITNILPGVNNEDAVVVSQVPKKFDDHWGFQSKTLSHVKGGTKNNDCVVKWQVMTLDEKQQYFDGRNKQISNVKQGTLDNDCVVKRQTITYNEPYRCFDARNIRISNVHYGLHHHDVCTMAQAVVYDNDEGTFSVTMKDNYKTFELMDKRNYPKLLVAGDTALSGFKTLDGKDYIVIPNLKIDHWDFASKRLSNIQEPVYDGEAVNLGTLHSLAITKKSKTDNNYNANNLKLSNIGDCEQDGDAVNKRMLDIFVKKLTKNNEKHLERLGSALFHYIHRSSGRSADAEVDSRNYLNWTEIHDPSTTLEEKEDDININEETENEEEPLRLKKVLNKNMEKQE